MLQRELTLEEIRNLKNKVEIFKKEDNPALIWVKYDWKIVIPEMFYTYQNMYNFLNNTTSVLYVYKDLKYQHLNLIWLDLVTWKIIDKISISSSLSVEKDTWNFIDREIVNKLTNEKIISQTDLEKHLWVKLIAFNEISGWLPPYYQWNIILDYKKKWKDKNKVYFIIYNVHDKKYISKEYEKITLIWWFYECHTKDDFEILNVDWKVIYSRKRNKWEILRIDTKENLLLVISDTQERYSHLVSIIEVDWKNKKYIEKDLNFLNKDQYVRDIKVWKNWEQQVFVFDEEKDDTIIYNLNWWTIISSWRLWDYDKKYQIQRNKNSQMLIESNTGKILLKYNTICMKKYSDNLIFIWRNNNDEIIVHDEKLNVIFEYDPKKDQFELLINWINLYNYKRDCILWMNWNKLYFIIKDKFDWTYKIIDEKKNCIKDKIIDYISEENWTFTLFNKDLNFENIDLKSL